MEVYCLKVNHLSNPLGYEMEKTVFSWKVRDTKAKKQSAARIRVGEGTDLDKDTLILDTGFINELASEGCELEVPLYSGKRYFWDVTVRTEKGEEAVSEVQWFETGKMEEPWTAKWITCSNEEARHPIFKKKIVLSKELQKARLYICGLGLYEAYYNDSKIGGEYLAPYCNDYNEWVQYQTYDVSEMLEKEGMLSVLLGNGWYKGRFGFDMPTDQGIYGNEWKLRAELVLIYKDGSRETIGTDESWTVERSNIVFSTIYDGEHRDDTLSKLPEEKAVLCEAPTGELRARLSTPVTAHEIFEPVSLIHTPAGETVLDMGQEFSGIFSLRVKEPAGTRIHIQTGEVLQNGNFYRENLRTAKSEYIYISDGTEKVIRPHFTFYGYRYVKIEGIKNLKKEDFKGIALYSEIPETGKVTTGNDLVNQLLSNIRWGMKSNFLDVPTDCPQRDERMGWTGDAQIFSEAATYLSDTWAFYRKYLYDMGREQKRHEGKVSQVVPDFGKEGTSSVWGDAACIIPWNLYQFYGDRSILEEQYESMTSWVEYIRKTDGEDHNWRNEFHYGDWLALDHPLGGENGFLGGTDERFLADVSYAASIEIVKKAAEILGNKEDAEKYALLEEEQRDWIKREYYTQTGKCCIRTQTAQLLTLRYGLTDNPKEAVHMLERLLDESDGKLRTGFVGTPLLCRILSENGLSDRAYELFLNEEYPGWLHEVKLGATTIWERWNSLDENGCISGTQMNSLNHYASGSVAEWVFRYAAGINNQKKDGTSFCGFRKIFIAPQINRKLGFLDAEYDSPAGYYRVRWEFTDDSHVKIAVSIPFGAQAELKLPGAASEVLEDKNNPMFENVQEGICFLDAGEYSVEYCLEITDSKLSVDSSMRQILKNEKAREFMNSMLPMDMLSGEFMVMSFRKLAVQFGNASEEQLKQIDEVLKTF